MKNSVKAFVIATVMGVSGSAFAAQSIDNNPSIEITAEPVKTEVMFENLPEAVQLGFQESDYAESTVNKIFKVEEEGLTSYEFYVGADNEVITFSEEGEITE
ncbi:hypothetical protein [Chondrinema litorale]|uniref:hypothetical protein n=1 Tax=Chondrinema litorale TaxID=2994555 RepID=UPI002543615E|nr:hypothetical protein [Chondrinema litorale]UZR94324.1 hypothetical protein OQ292_00650 [Chondrinema litorale]